MTVLPIYKVRVALGDQGEWKGTYIGRPTVDEIVEALQDKCQAEMEKLLSPSREFDRKRVLETFNNLIQLVRQFGFPAEGTQYLDCKYLGVALGKIDVVRNGDAKVASASRQLISNYA